MFQTSIRMKSYFDASQKVHITNANRKCMLMSALVYSHVCDMEIIDLLVATTEVPKYWIWTKLIPKMITSCTLTNGIIPRRTTGHSPCFLGFGVRRFSSRSVPLPGLVHWHKSILCTPCSISLALEQTAYCIFTFDMLRNIASRRYKCIYFVVNDRNNGCTLRQLV